MANPTEKDIKRQTTSQSFIRLFFFFFVFSLLYLRSSIMTTTTWFITGASAGIGAAIVEAALAKGDKVIAASRNALRLSQFKSKGAITVSFDVNGTGKEVEKASQQIIEKYGPIDVVVNNAGFGQFGSIEENGVDGLEQQFATNVYGPVKVIGGFLPHFRERKQGLFLNIGSGIVYTTVPFYSLYVASKAAIQQLSTSLDGEVKGFGIRSVLIEPGAFKTTFLENVLEDLKKNKSTETFPATISDYDEARKQCIDMINFFKDNAHGKPEVLGENLVTLVHKEGPFAKEIPEIVSFGGDTADLIEQYSRKNLERVEKWKDLALTTDKY